MKKTTKLLSLLLAFCFICSLFTGCNQSTDEELIVWNNAYLGQGMMDEEGGIYSEFYHLNYIDTKNCTGIPVCGKPECTHDDFDSFEPSCSAVWLAKDTQTVMYYQDYLYYDMYGQLGRCSSIGENKEQLGDFRELMREQVETVMRKDQSLKPCQTQISLSGICEEKLYIHAATLFTWIQDGQEVASGLEKAYALFTYDLKTGVIDRVEDEAVCALIEDIPTSMWGVNVSICGDLLFVWRNTAEHKRLSLSEDYFESNEAETPYGATEGNIENYVYNLNSKTIVKKWSVPYKNDTETARIIKNADKTFLYVEQVDGKYKFTEYNNECEKTVEFTLDYDYCMAKHGEYYYAYYYEREDEILRYHSKTGKKDVLKTDGLFFPSSSSGFHGIVDDVMLVVFGPGSEYQYALLDLSSFDTGEVKIRPVEGIAPLRRD